MSTIAAGTTSTTALVSTGDTTGKLTFQTNGTTTAMTIDTSQNVGIGTSAPGSLDPDARNLVVGGGSGNTGISIYSGNASSGRLMFADGTSGDGPYVGQIHYDHSSNYMRFITNGGERVRITSAGDVGIGGTPNNYGGQTCLTINNATGYSRVDLNIGGVKKSSIYGEGSSNMIFETAGSERMRIDSSGNVLVGTTSASNSGSGTRMQIAYAGGGTQYGLGFRPTTNTTVPIQFGNASGATVGTISQDASNVAYNTSSDYRLKENIAPMTGALAKVAALKPCTYNWKLDGSAGQGFIAHELAEVCPQAVTGKKDAVDENGKPVYQGVDTSFLVATLTAAIQELKAEVDALKAQLAKV